MLLDVRLARATKPIPLALCVALALVGASSASPATPNGAVEGWEASASLLPQALMDLRDAGAISDAALDEALIALSLGDRPAIIKAKALVMAEMRHSVERLVEDPEFRNKFMQSMAGTEIAAAATGLTNRYPTILSSDESGVKQLSAAFGVRASTTESSSSWDECEAECWGWTTLCMMGCFAIAEWCAVTVGPLGGGVAVVVCGIFLVVCAAFCMSSHASCINSCRNVGDPEDVAPGTLCQETCKKIEQECLEAGTSEVICTEIWRACLIPCVGGLETRKGMTGCAWEKTHCTGGEPAMKQ